MLLQQRSAVGAPRRATGPAPRALLPARAPTVTPKAAPKRPLPLLLSSSVPAAAGTTAKPVAAPAAATIPCSPAREQQQQRAAAAAHRGGRRVACAAAAASSGGGAGAGGEAGKAALPAWRIPVYILFWYAFNIVFNILNKTALNTFPCPWLIATWQLAASGLFMAALWLTGLQPRPPPPSKEFLLALLPVAFFHTVGHVSACVAFSQVAVSFTHVIKSAEPVFSVLLQGPILGTPAPPYYVWLSLLPIVAGCSLSAIKEVSFAWSGFNNAMISNLGMVLRNIYSKKSLNKYKDIDGINLFGMISIASLLYCAPAALIAEGAKWGPAWDAATANGAGPLLGVLAWGGLFYHLYNQASYMVLDQGVTPVTFSVANTMKRVAVVVSAVAFFRNPVSPLNWVGSGVAILGTYLYSAATDRQKAEEAARRKAA